MTIQNNAVGIETDGTGAFTLTDVVMSNTKDVLITGSSTMEFIEGSIDTTTVEVTGTGVFDRLRQLDVTSKPTSRAPPKTWLEPRSS